MKTTLRFPSVQRTVFGAALLCVVGIAPLATAKPPVASSPPKPKALQAQITANPAQLAPESTIEVTFPTPMIAREAVGKDAVESPVVVEPALSGTFQWTSSRSGQYHLTQPPQFNQTYKFRLRAGLKDLEGAEMSTAVMDDYNSARFLIIDQEPKWYDHENNAPRTPAFLFEFNDNVNPAEAVKAISFVSKTPAMTVPAKVRYATGQDFSKHYGEPDPTWAEEIAKVTPKLTPEAVRMSAIVVEPAEPLPVAEGWVLQISKKLTNASGRDTLEAGDDVTIGNVLPLQVASAKGRTPFDSPYFVQIRFNKDILPPSDGERSSKELRELGAKLAALVHIDPPVQVDHADLDDDTLAIHGSFALNKPYQITVEPGFPAADGLVLDAPATFSTEFEPNPPYIGAPVFMRSQIASGKGTYEFSAANVTKVRVRVRSFSGPQLLESIERFLPYQQRFDERVEKRREFTPEPFDSYPGNVVYEHEYPINKPLDQSELISLNWHEILGQTPAAPLFVEIEGEAMKGMVDKKVVAQSLIEFTDLGVMQKSNQRDAFIYVTSLRTWLAVEGARVTLVDADRKLLGSGETDANGLVQLAAPEPAYVLVENAGDCTVLKASGGSSELWGIYGEGVDRAWQNVWQGRRQTFLFSDRTLFRPGETAHLKAWTRLRVGDDLVMDRGPVKGKLEIRDPRYKVILEKDVVFNENGAWQDDVKLPSGPLGHYQINVDVKGESDGDEDAPGYLSVQVQDFRPNSFEVHLDAKDAKLLKDRVELPMSANYYMGKSLGKAKVSWSATSIQDFTPPESFASYHFGDAPYWAGYGRDRDRSNWDRDESGQDEWYVSGDGALTEDGSLTLQFPMPPPQREALPQKVHVTAEVTDINEQTISAGEDIEVPGAAFLLGVKGPDFFATAGNEVLLDLVAVRPHGEPVTDVVKVEVKIEKQEYNTIKIATAGGGSTTKEQVMLREELKQSLELRPVTAGGTASLTLPFTPAKGGSYFITAEATDAGGKKILSRLPIYVIGSGEFPWAMEDGVAMNLQPEKSTLKPGEEAVIVVKSPIEGTALVTVERNRMHRHFSVPFTLANPVIKVPVSEEDAPNVFVSVVIIRGADASPKEHKMPEFRVGYCGLTVESDAHALVVEVKPAKPEILPAETMDITATVQDAKGAPISGADVTLCAVDEGVLSLTHYKTPDPASYFLPPFNLAFSTFASFGDLLQEDSTARERGNKGFLVGGGGEDEDADVELRKNFIATPLWIGSSTTDADGRVIVKVTAPDNLSRFRIMAVVAAGADRFGKAESSFEVNKPLMIEPVIPRFARLGDEVLVKAVIHNTTKNSGNVEMQLELDDSADFIREAKTFNTEVAGSTQLPATGRKVSRTLAIKAGETISTSFPVRFTAVGAGKWNWSVKSVNWQDGVPAVSDGTESNFNVEQPLPELREVRYSIAAGAAPPDNLLKEISPAILEGQGAVRVNISSSRLFEVHDALSYVLHYPYGCVEQTTSAAMPWLALSGYENLFPDLLDGTRRKEVVQASVDRLMQMTTDDGGLAYWPGGKEANLWGSAYGGMLLLRAKTAGAMVPDDTVDALMDFLSKRLRGLDDERNDYVLADSALALYTLARAKRSEPAYHNLLYGRRERLPETARLYLGLAILLSDGPEQQVKDLIGWRPSAPPVKGAKKAVARPRPTSEWTYWAGNQVNKALRLICYVHMGLTADANEVAEQIMRSRNGRGEWGNTYTNAWMLTALSAYDRSQKSASQPISTMLAWGAQTVPLNLDKVPGVTGATLPLTAALTAVPMSLALPADRDTFVRVEARAFPPARDFAGENKGFAITRTYEKLGMDGALSEANELKVGDMVVVTLGVEIAGGERYLAINDSLPSVLEAINPEFGTQNERDESRLPDGMEAWFCDHREIHADRALFFTDYAPAKGRFGLRYLARVIAEGDVIAPPAKIEAMYEPEKYGLSASQRIITLPGTHGKVAGR